MTLVRWNPARELATLQTQMDRLFEGADTPPLWSAPRSGFFPVVDVVETAEAYVLRAELPGVRKEDVKLHLVDNVLTLKGTKVTAATEEKAQYLHTERAFGSFERSFTLGTPIQGDTVTATYTEGVLEVRVAKSETQRLKEITIA